MHRLLLLFVALLVAALAACEGCRSPRASAPEDRTDAVSKPTARLYFVSDLAGALEPCGCVKDQLGGMDHFGALVTADRKASGAPAGLLAAGPLFFMDMELTDEKRQQEIGKAQTIASSLKDLSLLAFAPARNEWAVPEDVRASLVQATGAPMLAANLPPSTGAQRWVIKDVGGIKIGLVGVSTPDKARLPLPDVTSTAPADAVREGVAALEREGAQVIIALASVGRGEAKRIADVNPKLLAVVVGASGGGGESNTQAPPAERIGNVLVVETANHLQTVSTLDLFVRGGGKAGGLLELADATGIERIRKREELTGRIDELRKKIAIWENEGKVDKKDVDARKADVARLEAERAELDKTPPPATGSFYRYTTHDIREKLGRDDAVRAQMVAYYKRVNERNKVELKDKRPKPPPKGEPGYVGHEMCTNCHEDARKVWDKTRHAHAYKTLVDEFKEYNLDCVSCHVTGYDRPGGSTVTHVEDLKDVQCEVCHGPGSLHATTPDKVAMPVPRPTGDTCLACHHPPHVHAFDPQAKMPEILGPGHGRKK